MRRRSNRCRAKRRKWRPPNRDWCSRVELRNGMRIVACLILFALAGCSSGRQNMEREATAAARKLDREAAKAKIARASNWGHFSGPVETRWENDGATMVLLSELRYTDPYGE